jgi:hypothetical protein
MSKNIDLEQIAIAKNDRSQFTNFKNYQEFDELNLSEISVAASNKSVFLSWHDISFIVPGKR